MDFLAYIRLLKKYWGAGLTGIVAPAVCLPLHFCPPWPDPSGATSCAVAAVFCLVGLLVPFAFSGARERALALSVRTGATAALCLVMYIACWSLWVGEGTQTNGGQEVTTRFVKGIFLAVPTNGLPEKIVLERNGYRVEVVYTSTSLMVTRLALLSSFSGTFFFLTMAYGFTAFRTTRGR